MDHLEKECQIRSECNQISEQNIQAFGKSKEVEVGLLDTDKVYRMKQDRVEKFSAYCSKISGIFLKNSECFGEEAGASNIEEHLETRRSVRDRERS